MKSFNDIENFAEKLDKIYPLIKEKTLNKRRIKHKDIAPLIEKAVLNKILVSQKLGESTEGRSIYLLKAGTGKTKVFLWSQMHGDEPTATQALFDIFNLLNNPNETKDDLEQILKNVTLYFVPMLNPDGAEVFKRRNSLDIDLNRDAVRLAAKESKILKELSEEIKADFGFNLHDQVPYYTVGNTGKPASLSFLSPAFNFAKDINENRKQSMQTVVLMNRILQKYIPGQVGKYFDAFGPTCVGDNFQKTGVSTILIESGECTKDKERQYVRKLNFIIILSAIKGISEGSFSEISTKEYDEIPEISKERIFHLLIRNAKIKRANQFFTIDLAIIHNEINNVDSSDFTIQSEIFDIGDLSNYYGYKEINAEGMLIESNNSKVDEIVINIGDSADFILTKNNKVEYEIKNGQIVS